MGASTPVAQTKSWASTRNTALTWFWHSKFCIEHKQTYTQHCKVLGDHTQETHLSLLNSQFLDTKTLNGATMLLTACPRFLIHLTLYLKTYLLTKHRYRRMGTYMSSMQTPQPPQSLSSTPIFVTLCVSAVFAVARCLSVRLSRSAFYRDGSRYRQTSFSAR